MKKKTEEIGKSQNGSDNKIQEMGTLTIDKVIPSEDEVERIKQIISYIKIYL